jgi:hypothetical protein
MPHVFQYVRKRTQVQEGVKRGPAETSTTSCTKALFTSYSKTYSYVFDELPAQDFCQMVSCPWLDELFSTPDDRQFFCFYLVQTSLKRFDRPPQDIRGKVRIASVMARVSCSMISLTV